MFNNQYVFIKFIKMSAILDLANSSSPYFLDFKVQQIIEQIGLVEHGLLVRHLSLLISFFLSYFNYICHFKHDLLYNIIVGLFLGVDLV